MPTSYKKKRRLRVLVADDNREVRDKVVQLLRPDFEVVGTAEDGKAVFEAVLLLEPDILVLDISMPGMNGIEAAKELRRAGPPVKIVFLTVHDDPDFVRAALGTGASGYVIKSQMATDLTDAMRAAVEGNLFISPACAMNGDGQISAEYTQ